MAHNDNPGRRGMPHRPPRPGDSLVVELPGNTVIIIGTIQHVVWDPTTRTWHLTAARASPPSDP
jgi:hypothetical protein